MKDKIIFWIDTDLTQFCIAHFLQEVYDCDLFALVDMTSRQRKFLQEQQFVKFQKWWYYFDHIKFNKNEPDITYLKSFEEKYNINLWKIAVNERIFYRFNKFYKFTTNEILSVLEQECKLFENILDEVKPDFLVTADPTLHHKHLFYEICKIRGIKVLVLHNSKLGFKCSISQKPYEIDLVDNLDNFPESNRSFDDLQALLKSFNMAKKVENYSNVTKATKLKQLYTAFNYLVISDNKSNKTHYTYFGRKKLRVIFDTIVTKIKTKYRKSFVDNNLLTSIDYNEDFVYFPLHVDLDKSLLIGAPFFTNQIEMLRSIVKSLPIGYKLYLKEHPNAVLRQWRPISEYKEIMNIPNVRVFHPSVPVEEFYQKCSMVITISGTAGFEAAIHNKPSIIFADFGYSLLSSVHRMKAIEELPDVIRATLKKKINLSELDKYVTILDQNSFDFDWNGFQTVFLDYFFHGGNLIDTEIPVSKMKSFLEENESMLKNVALEHVKKIKQLKGI